jgi:hypothetical protein
MRRLIIMLSLLFAAVNICALELEISDNHINGSRFWRNSLLISTRPYYPFYAGVGFDLTEHKNFNNHIYALRAPLALQLSQVSFKLQPFYYPDNANGSYAWGGKFTLFGNMNRDEVNQEYSGFYLSAALGAQKADVLRGNFLTEKESFYQAAYELGLNYSFFDRYGFDISGNVYQYMSGIDGVKDLRGVMNQAELADLATLDHTMHLPKFSAGTKISWNSDVSRSDNYIAYRYIYFHNAGASHSLRLSRIVNVYKNFFLSLSYNHLFQSGGDADIFGAGAVLKFI